MTTVEAYLRDLQYHRAAKQHDPHDALFCSYLVCLDEGKPLSDNELNFIQQHIDQMSIDFLLVYDHKSLVISNLIQHRKIINSLKVFEYAITSKPTFDNILEMGELTDDEIDVIIKNISSFEPTEIKRMIENNLFENHLILTFDFLLRACLYHGCPDTYAVLNQFFDYAKRDNSFYPEIDINIFHLFMSHNAYYELIQYTDNDIVFVDYIQKLSNAGVQVAIHIEEYLSMKSNLMNF